MGNFFLKKKNSPDANEANRESFQNAKRVCAIFDFDSTSPEELSFRKNDIMKAVYKSNSLWWFARHETSREQGFIPKNFVVDYENSHIFLSAWHEFTNIECNRKLMKADQAVGTYLVRPCSDGHHFVLSVKSGEDRMPVKNYKIIFENEKYFIFPKIRFSNPADLIQYYSGELSSGLCCQLGAPYSVSETPILQFRKIEVNRYDIEIIKEIGHGHFSIVYLATHRVNKMTVAVKRLRQNHDDRRAFMKEAKIMHRFHHDRIVKLLGVCTLPSSEPMHIITEYMEKGALDKFLRNQENRHSIKLREMIIILMEITEGMSYLESKSFIHRDLRAANILVAKDGSVKVADFGLARIVEELYVEVEEREFPMRWIAYEALCNGKFTLKSDVWSFGILMYEVITHGKDPYPDFNLNEVKSRVRAGYKMPKPINLRVECPDEYYAIMKNCWKPHRERPSFVELCKTFREWSHFNNDICPNGAH